MMSALTERLKVLSGGRENSTLTCCVTLGKITNLSVPQFLYLPSGHLLHGIK